MIAMCARLSILGLVVLGAAGCSDSTMAEKPKPVEGPRIPIPKLSEPPPPRGNGTLELIVGEDRVRLGDTVDTVEKVFPVPAGAVPFKDLPPGAGPGYLVRGYETTRGSFGALFVDNGLVLALERRENVDPYLVGETISLYEKAYGPPTKVISKRIQYYFWEKKEYRRIMICSTPDPKHPETIDLNIAMGDVEVMDQVRMSVDAARKDQAALAQPVKQ